VRDFDADVAAYHVTVSNMVASGNARGNDETDGYAPAALC
jgi:hypothetical protein